MIARYRPAEGSVILADQAGKLLDREQVEARVMRLGQIIASARLDMDERREAEQIMKEIIG